MSLVSTMYLVQPVNVPKEVPSGDTPRCMCPPYGLNPKSLAIREDLIFVFSASLKTPDSEHPFPARLIIPII